MTDAASDVETCTCGHDREQHEDDAACLSWRCVCISFHDREQARRDFYNLDDRDQPRS